MEESIKILEEFKTKGYALLLMEYGDRNKTNLKIERAIEHLIKGYRDLHLAYELYKSKSENLEKGYRALEENYKIAVAMLTRGTYPPEADLGNHIPRLD